MNFDVLIWTYFNGHEECSLRSWAESDRECDEVAIAFQTNDSEHWSVIRQVKVFRNGRLHRKLVR